VKTRRRHSALVAKGRQIVRNDYRENKVSAQTKKPACAGFFGDGARTGLEL